MHAYVLPAISHTKAKQFMHSSASEFSFFPLDSVYYQEFLIENTVECLMVDMQGQQGR